MAIANGPTKGGGGSPTTVSLGTASARVTGGSHTSPPVHRPVQTLDKVVLEPLGASPTDIHQRYAAFSHSPLDLIDGRPQEHAAHRIRSVTKFHHGTPSITAELEAEALDVDLGQDYRWVADPAKTDYDIVTGTSTWRGSQFSGGADHDLEITALSAGARVPLILDDTYGYWGRTGLLTRPALLWDEQWIGSWYDAVDPDDATPLTKFTIAFVAFLHEGQASFSDLFAFHSPGVSWMTPEDAKTCTLRFNRDRLQVYANGRRITDYLVNQWGMSSDQSQTKKQPRPTIVVWSMDHNGSGALVVRTPNHHMSEDLSFDAGATWKMPLYVAGSGVDWTGIDLNDDYLPTIAHADFFDIALWTDTALDTGDAHQVAAALDDVYGVAS